jgi:SPP1 gp7 family putative phage head morphogenesis protein
MKKDNENDYWKKRAIRDSVKMFLNAEETEKLIDSAYDYAKNLLTNEILALVKRAKTKTGYDIEKVIKLLKEEVPTSELILLNQMVKTTKDKKTKKYLRKTLDLLAIQFRISRLDVLHTKALILAKKVGEQQEKLSTKLFKQIIEDTHKEERANLLEIREEKLPDPVMLDENNNPKKLIKLTEDVEVKPPKGSKVITPKIIDTKEVDKAQIDTLLKSSWHGDNYSSRIWKDTDQLAKKLQQLFTVESMTGMSELDMAREIEQYMHDAFMLNKNIARRLIRTEANRFHTQAKIQQWEKMGLKHVKYVAVLDNRTSDTCERLNGLIFPLDSLETGVNCPPMHPWCRSIIQAYFGPVIEFHTYHDPIREVMGSMFESHPEETEKVLKELKDMGIEVFFLDGKKMTYSPGNAEFGRSGHISINRNASYSALMHERQHVIDDIHNGYPGMMHYIKHKDLRWEFEKRAYLVELEIYKRYNVGEEYIERLKKLMDNEYNDIYHKGDESK